MSSQTAFNPLDKQNLAKSIADALLKQELHTLPPATSFKGSGVYLIYYNGPFKPYAKISEQNRKDFQTPIYVGKASTKGARKGLPGFDEPVGHALHKRLRKHAESISATSNLELKDFRCRYLILDDVWLILGESLLIQKFAPLWNRILEGFGNNAPGGNRAKQKRSPWDEVHRGRAWADECQPNKQSLKELLKAADDFLNKKMPI